VEDERLEVIDVVFAHTVLPQITLVFKSMFTFSKAEPTPDIEIIPKLDLAGVVPPIRLDYS
jgi:hypothetical protein